MFTSCVTLVLSPARIDCSNPSNHNGDMCRSSSSYSCPPSASLLPPRSPPFHCSYLLLCLVAHQLWSLLLLCVSPSSVATR